MELAFATETLRSTCGDHDKAVNLYGNAAADALRTRLADLRAVNYLSELPTGMPEVMEGNLPRLRFVLEAGWSMLARIGQSTVPRNADGSLDLSLIHRALILEISQ
jgi:hypothetical protein